MPSVKPEPTEAEWLALCAEDLAAYTSLMYPRFRLAAHHRLIVEALEDVEAGRCKRLMIFMPPRHGKSLIASQHFAPWYIGRNPAKYVIALSHGQELADEFGRAVRNQIADPMFDAVFPGVTLRQDSKSAGRFNTPQGGSYFASGMVAPTGRGAHVLLIDDPVKSREDADSETHRKNTKSAYQAVAYTRLMPEGAIVLIMTRWHEDDLAGWLLREHAHEGWRVLSLPAVAESGDVLGREPGAALWPSAYPVEALHRIRRALSSREWSALYQQRPYSDEGAILKRDWWRPWIADADSTALPGIKAADKRVTCAPIPANPDFIIVSLDTAYTKDAANDPTACTIWYVVADPVTFRTTILLRYSWEKRLDFPDLISEIADTCKEFGKSGVPLRVVIEAMPGGLSVIQELRRRHPEMSIHGVNPRTGAGGGDKVARAHAVTSYLEGGAVYALAWWRGEKIVWRDPAQRVIDNCAAFPLGAHDDLTDSTTQALRYVRDQGVELFAEDEPAAPAVATGPLY